MLTRQHRFQKGAQIWRPPDYLNVMGWNLDC